MMTDMYPIRQEVKTILKKVAEEQELALRCRQSLLPNVQLVGKAQSDLLQRHEAMLLDLLDKLEG